MKSKLFNTIRSQRVIQRACPYYDGNKQVCLASTGMIVPGHSQQMNYCASDDYDNCPLYLCKALRSSRRQVQNRVSLVDCGK